nr:50S ribosomal protein L4P [uncultured archaeon]
MKLPIKTPANTDAGNVTAPVQFDEPFRPDLIARAVLSLQAGARQPYGAYPEAGKRASSKVSRRRRDYRGSYGFGISRVPRKVLNRRGTRMYYVGAFAPGTVKGRRAHPPKSWKNWEQKINEKENRKAIRSALAASLDKKIVAARGHKLPPSFPFILSDEFETLTKTKEVVAAFEKLGLALELERASEKKIRAGKGKMRGRRYKKTKGPLVVVSANETKLALAARNVPGLNLVAVDSLNCELLAPGTHAGRLTLFTARAIQRLADERLFMNDYKGARVEPAPLVEKKAAPAKTVKPATPKTAKPPAKKGESA